MSVNVTSKEHNKSKQSSSDLLDQDDYSRSHNCLWRRSYEEEHLKRTEVENSIIKYLKKLEAEKERYKDLVADFQMMKERVTYLEQRNVLLEGELKQRDPTSNRRSIGVTDSQREANAELRFSTGSSYDNTITSPSQKFLDKWAKDNKIIGRNMFQPDNLIKVEANPSHQIFQYTSNPDVRQSFTRNSSQQNRNGGDSLDTAKLMIKQQRTQARRANNQSTCESVQRYRPSYPTIDQAQPLSKIGVSSDCEEQKRESSNKVKYMQTMHNFNSNGLSIDYKDNDPQFYNIDEVDNGQKRGKDQREKTQALKNHFQSGNNLNSTQNTAIDTGQSKTAKYRTSASLAKEDTQSQVLTQIQQEKDDVKGILRVYKKQNLSFSKLKIISVDGEGHIEKIRLKQDPIRIAQREHQHRHKNRKDLVAKSMQFGVQGEPNLHQIQPLHMLKRFDKGFQMQLQGMEVNNQMQEEEEIWDEQEGDRNQIHQDINRAQVKFSNHDTMTYQSPRQYNHNQLVQVKEENEDDLVETQRDSSFHDHNLLETPAHRIITTNGNQDYSIQNQDGLLYQYDEDYKLQLSNSLRNRSTNKKNYRRKVGQPKPKLYNQDKRKKNAFIVDQPIKEETPNLLSDEEDEQEITPSEQKGKRVGNLEGDNRLVKNPNYARITHASKHMDFPAPMRGADTGTRQRNEFSKNNNPLLKSMPNFDFFRDQKSPIPYEENSMIQHTSVNLEVNSSFSQTTSVNNLIPFSSPGNRGDKRVASSPSPSRVSRRSNHLFEEFFIIGVNKDELTQLDWRKTDTHRVSPETQYLHIADKKDDCDRRRVVKDFCFPDGIEVKKLNKSSSLDQAQKILYSSKSLRESFFVFTLNADDEAVSENSLHHNLQASYLETFPGGSQSEKYYNCMCVIFNELISPNEETHSKSLNNQEMFTSKKAFCFMFVNSYYQLHLDVINALTNALKLERMRIQEQLDSSSKTSDNATHNDIISMLKSPLITELMRQILDECYKQTFEDFSLSEHRLVIDISPNIGQLQYDIPPLTEQTYLDNYWFCPVLFSLFSADTFVKLLSAVLLEQTIVFVGKQSLLSSTILGFNTLLYPFKWCLALVPILPHPLIEMLEAPLPILVGITQLEYQQMTLTQEEIDSKVWVFLESSEVTWLQNNRSIPELNFNNLRQRIEPDLQNFEQQGCASTFPGSRSSELTDAEMIPLINDELKSNCRMLCDKIRKTLKDFILSPLKGKQIQDIEKLHKQDSLLKEIGNIILRSSSSGDRPFLEAFLETQMFATYIEENFLPQFSA